VIGLGVLIVIAFGALVVGMVAKMGGHTAPAPAPAASGAFALPPGGRIVEMQSQPGRLILRVRTAEGEEVDILDTDDGHLVARVKAAK
jgi:hypothetical protein